MLSQSVVLVTLRKLMVDLFLYVQYITPIKTNHNQRTQYYDTYQHCKT